MERDLIQRILVVDDEEEYRMVIQRYLEKSGYTCDSSSNASESLDKLARDRYDLVISDIRMKGLDGLQLMREALQRYEYLSFILMTGYVAEYSYSDIIAAGATDFISKPFHMEELKAKLKRITMEKRAFLDLRLMNEALSREVEINISFAELSRALLSPLSFESISDLVLSCAKRLTESSIGFVGYMEPSSGCLTSPVMGLDFLDNCQDADEETVLEESRELWRATAENRNAIFTNAPVEDGCSSGGPPPCHPLIRQFLSAPAVANNQLLGQISLANASRDYDEKDLMLVKRLSDIYALAIHRKLADEELRNTEAELRKARDELEKLVEERTAKLSQAGELIKRSIYKFREITEG